MPFSMTDKQQLVEQLMEVRRQAQLVELTLRSQNQPPQADKVHDAIAALTVKIDALLGGMMQNWIGQADQAVGDLKGRTDDLTKAVDQIKRQVQVAQTVVKVIGYVDQAVAIAAKVAATL